MIRKRRVNEGKIEGKVVKEKGEDLRYLMKNYIYQL